MKKLLEAARAAQFRAYVPYSRFRVGCALKADTGEIFTGCNVENAAYPQGQCAEATAVGVMVAGGRRRIVEVAVVGDSDGPCAPCGGCRQRLAEFASPGVPVHMAGRAGDVRTATLGELLPFAFGPDHLDAPVPAAAPNAVEVIRARTELRPEIGLVLGSGLGGIAEALTEPVALAYGDLPGFPAPGVAGHEGRLVIGRLEGVPVALMQGRAHLYEGAPAAWPVVPIRTLEALGCGTILLTNAAGALGEATAPGTVVLIADHINGLGANPLAGPNDDGAGPRFPDMSAVYDAAIRSELKAAAQAIGVDLPEGVYLATLGPSFETPAEIRAFRALGADLVGMSTVPEAIVAAHAGLRVAGLSIVANLAAGLSTKPLAHDETLRIAGDAAITLERILRAWLSRRAEPIRERPS